MPVSKDFKSRIFPKLDKISDYFSTPFHIYDEKGIRQTCNELKKAFSGINNFKEYFAVKALPNPAILKIIKDEGFGFDCSSIPELTLARQQTNDALDIIFTSNNTTKKEFIYAMSGCGSIINLDDISLIDKLPEIPELVSFRYNPGPDRTGNAIIGKPSEAKYGLAKNQIIDAYRKIMDMGAKKFGIHAMVASNELNEDYIIETARMLLDLCEKISGELGIKFEFINIGGGLGIPYRPEEKSLDIFKMGNEITKLFKEFAEKNLYEPALNMESGRFMTGPHGILVTKVINTKDIYRKYVGLDASMPALMRPGIYGAYHHVEIPGKEDDYHKKEVVDITGSLCENNDKFAIQRELPKLEENDIVVIEDTGAHGHSMGFNYNGRLRPKELLFTEKNEVILIRREEEEKDHFATLEFDAKSLKI
ncbi:MAG: diaminopimelate decarboxylase [Deltaproteobacteria bacterium]|nr:MAG: diaminopimelate decarboxylase [Deltaproteobacteria bacterium]